MEINNKKVIEIDGKKYEVEHLVLGKELKELAGIPDKTLFKEIPHEADVEIIIDQYYTLENGMKFYTESSHEKIKMFINHREYTLENVYLTGAQLKDLAGVQPEEYKLLKEVLNGSDLVIEDAVTYYIENEDEFFTVHIDEFPHLIKLTILFIDENYTGRFNVHQTLKQVLDDVIEKLSLLLDMSQYYVSIVGLTQELDLSLTIQAAGLKDGDKLQFIKRISGGGERS